MVILPPRARDIRDSDRQGFGRLRRDRNRRFEYGLESTSDSGLGSPPIR